MKLLPSLSWFLVFHKCLSCSSHTSSHPESFFQNSLISWQENLLHSGKLGLDSIILVDPFQLTNSVVTILFLFFSVRSAVWQFASEFGFHLLIRCANLALITPSTAISKPGNFNFPHNLSKLPSVLLDPAFGHSSCRGGMLMNPSFVSFVLSRKDEQKPGQSWVRSGRSCGSAWHSWEDPGIKAGGGIQAGPAARLSRREYPVSANHRSCGKQEWLYLTSRFCFKLPSSALFPGVWIFTWSGMKWWKANTEHTQGLSAWDGFILLLINQPPQAGWEALEIYFSSSRKVD